MKKLNTVIALLTSMFLLVACGGSSDSSNNNSNDPKLRAVHLSPNAPNVDVSVAGTTALEGVSYRQASSFLPVTAGNNNIKVLVANTSTAVIDADLDLQEETKTTVIVVNTVDSIEPLVISDDNQTPASGNAALRVVHGAPLAPAVDVYVSAPGDEFDGLSPLLQGVAFKAVSDELEVPAGDYRVRVTAEGDSTVIYDSGSISLTSGVEYIAVAAQDNSTRAPIGLMILTDTTATPFVNLSDNNARVRVVHASADAPEVNISVDGSVVLNDVPFSVGSDYLQIPSNTYNIDVSAAANHSSVINADLTFDPTKDYTIAAVNSLSNIEPLVLVDDNTAPAFGNIKVRLVHAAPSAGSVDVYITAPDGDYNMLNPTFENFNFKDNSGYVEVPAGDYRVYITLAGTKTLTIDTGTLSLSSGQILTAFALDPAYVGDYFGALFLNDVL